MPEEKMDQSRVLELKSALQTRVATIEEGLAKGVKVDGANVEVSTESATAIRKAMSEAQEIKGLLDAHGFLTAASVPQDALAVQNGAATKSMLPKSLASMFLESPEFKNLQKSGRLTMDAPFQVEVMDLARANSQTKDVYGGSGNHTITHGFGRIQFDPMVQRAQRRNRVRDLFPVVGTTANLIDFFRVTGYAQPTEGAKSVPDYVPGAPGTFGLKPHTNLVFESAQAPVRTIAHWEAAHRNVISDEPQLQGTIENELMYGLTLEEDRQILQGTGANEELLGILNTPGIQTYSQAAAPDTKADAVRRAATRVILANYEPTGIVVHPFDWEDIELLKGSDGHYSIVTNVTVGATAQLWRQPVVETPAMPENTFLTGAFGLGAQLYDRMVGNIRIAEQHSDFFVRNAVVILAEERLALACKRPESFVKGTFIP